ncbi:hypothetical protein ACQKWADRAFT_298115 [Trichoderma austrokoningii]
MVNPGHASKGCTTCKMRRIRCDYGRPFCVRCTKSKRICLGYSAQAKTSHRKPSYKDVDLTVPSSAVATCRLTESSPLPSFSQFKKGYGAAQSNIDCFCLTSTYGGINTSRFVWDSLVIEPSADREYLGIALWSMLETLQKAFYSLRLSIQTMEARKGLIQKYGYATRQLREALTAWPYSSALLIPVFHFSLYEMIVNLDPADRTWQTHLSGLLIIIQQLPDNTPKFTLTKAVQISVTDAHKALETSTVDGLQRACLLLDIVKLRLRKLVAEIDVVAGISPPPLRKLDMQKLQVSIKHIRKHLDLFPIIVGDSIRSILVPLGPGSSRYVNQMGKGSHNDLTDDDITMQWIQFHTLQILTSAALLKIGGHLYPDATYHGRREFKALSHIIQEAAEGICYITASCIGLEVCSQTASYRFELSQIRTKQSLMLIWPLFCVSTAPALSDGQKSWARQVLWAIGEKLSIPKALSLARSSRETITQSDILAGILLVNLLSILPNPLFM